MICISSYVTYIKLDAVYPKNYAKGSRRFGVFVCVRYRPILAHAFKPYCTREIKRLIQ